MLSLHGTRLTRDPGQASFASAALSNRQLCNFSGLTEPFHGPLLLQTRRKPLSPPCSPIRSLDREARSSSMSCAPHSGVHNAVRLAVNRRESLPLRFSGAALWLPCSWDPLRHKLSLQQRGGGSANLCQAATPHLTSPVDKQ